MKKPYLFAASIILALLLLLGCSLIPGQSNLVEQDYDVIVIGSDPEGIAAAVSSSRNGNKTLLVDSRKTIGGLLILGKLNTLDMNFDPDQKLLTRGIFEEFYKQIEGNSFDITTAQTVFDKMVLAEANLTLQMEQQIIEVIMEDNQIIGLKTKNNSTENIYKGKIFIDATQDGDIAYLAGVDFTYGQEDFGGPSTGQVVTLVFEVGGVDWGELQRALNKPGDSGATSGATKDSAWGFLEEMRIYQGIDPQIRTRGPNIGRMKNGNVLINAMHIFGVDGLDPESKKEGIARGTREAENIVEHMKKQIPAFKNAYLVGVADELYVRETRHMNGLYRLTIDDVLEHRDFWDKIAIGSYPVDLQPTSIDNWGYVIGNPAAYGIPFRSIAPKEIKNLMVVGRSASFDSLAHGSARVVPIGMCTGQAAGAAAKIMLKNSLTVQELASSEENIKELQDTLTGQGAYLPKLNYAYNLKDHPTEDAIKYLRKYGLVYGKYNNDYELDENISRGKYLDIVEKLYLRQKNTGNEAEPNKNWFNEGPITAEEGIRIIESVYKKKIDLDNLGLGSKNKNILLTREQAYRLIHQTCR